MNRRTALRLAAGGWMALACGQPAEDPSVRFGELEISVRGHGEISADGIPRFLPSDDAPILCVQTAAAQDTTQWQLTEDGKPRPIADRSGRTLCYELNRPTRVPQFATVHAELVDAYDGSRLRLSPIEVEFTAEDPNRRTLQKRFSELMSMRGELSAEQLDRRLEELHADSMRNGFSILALRTRLVRAFFLRRTGRPESQRLAAEILADRPQWLDGPHADVWAAQHAYERASLWLETSSDASAAWQALREADDRYAQVVDDRRITVAMKQADLLSMSGSPRTGRERLKAAIEQCTSAECNSRFLGAAENTLSWLTLQDPEAGPAELALALSIAQSGFLQLKDSEETLERANAAINLAFAQARAKEDPAQSIAEAGRILATVNSEPERRLWIEQWGRLAAATYAIEQGDFDLALGVCDELRRQAKTPDLAARSLGCLAAVQRKRGETAAAYETLRRAIVLEQLADLETFAWQNPSGTAQLKHHLILAAGLAVELHHPEEAWEYLEALDRPPTRSPQHCGQAGTSGDGSDWNRLLVELLSIEGPASADLRELRQQIQPQLKLEIQRRLQLRSGCTLGGPEFRAPEVDFRAFYVAGRVTLLRRTGSGTVDRYRTRYLDRAVVERSVSELEQALQAQDTGERSWFELTRELSEALVPDPAALGARTRFALHGILQRVPLGALPIPGSAGKELLADRTLVVFRPAAAVLQPAASAATASQDPARRQRPVFVIDPTGNLPGSATAVDRYRALFPAAEILDRQSATREAVTAAIGSARWLHLGAHGELDPAFPELSRVQLADGATPIALWAERAAGLEFANLSMCSSGRWPVVADSARHGPAGLFAAHGTAWVVAARTDLANPVALEFNRGFYGRIAAGDDVPTAFQAALRMLRDHFPPEKWGSLLVVQGVPQHSPGQGGRFVPARTLAKGSGDPGDLPDDIDRAKGSTGSDG